MLTIRSYKVKPIYQSYYPLIKKLFKQIVDQYYPNKSVELSLVMTSSEHVHFLNKEYRGIDRTTDVLTFAGLEGDMISTMDTVIELGDIFINIDAISQQAKEYGHSEKREFCFLFVHGLLHTLGYDHMNETDAKVMFDLQDKYLDPWVPREK